MQEKVWVPGTAQIEKGMEVGQSSVEGAEYLRDEVKYILEQANLLDKPESQDLLGRLDEYVEYVKFLLISKAQPWYAQSVAASGLKNMQENIANAAAIAFKDLNIEGNLRVDVAVSRALAFIRGYSLDGRALPNEAVGLLDKLFNSFLVYSNFMSQGSKLHRIDDKGGILPNQNDTPEEIGVLIEKKFPDFMETKGIRIAAHRQVHPEVKEEVEKAAITKTVETPEQPTQIEVDKPQTPQV